MAEFLWHGSTTQELKRLEPKKDFTPQVEGGASPVAVYAGKDPAYAAAHSLRESTIGTGIEICRRGRFIDGKPDWGPIRLEIPEKLKHLLEVPASVYKLAAEGFEYLPHVPPEGENYRSKNVVDVIEELKFPSISKAVEEMGGLVIFKQEG